MITHNDLKTKAISKIKYKYEYIYKWQSNANNKRTSWSYKKTF